MIKFVILALILPMLNINYAQQIHQNDSVISPLNDRSIKLITGIINSEIRVVSGVLDSIANEVNRNAQMLQTMSEPLKRMLDLLSPKLVIEYIGEMYAVSDDCADTEIRLMVIHKREILDESLATFRQIFSAFRSYFTQTDILFRGVFITWPTSSSSIESSLSVILSSITSSLIDFLKTASKILSSFTGNMETLVDLPEQTFLSATTFATNSAYKYISLAQFVGDMLKSLASELDSSYLGRAVTSQLNALKSFVNNDIRHIQRGLLGLVESNRSLQILISQLMHQLVTATGAQAVTIQQQIDDAEDQVNKNLYVIDMLRNIIQRYTSLSNEISAAPILI